MGRSRILLVTVALAGTVVATAPSPALAATLVVDTTLDVVDGGDGLTSLREAFAAANGNGVDDTIELAASATYLLTSCATGALEHVEDRQLTILADGSNIEQTCPDVGVLSSTGPTSLLRVVGATIEGGPNTGVSVDGAGIYHEGRLELDGTTVTGVDSGLGTVVQGSGDPGADTGLVMTGSAIVGNVGNAVRLSFGSVSVSGSTISDNTGDGIGLTDGTPVVVTETVIDGNGGRGVSTTGQGYSTLTINETQVTGNGRGGALCTACAHVDIDSSDISGNGLASTAGGGGGVLLTVDQEPFDGTPRLDITASTIDGNVARRPGGGIRVGQAQAAIDPTLPGTIVSLIDVTVSGNQTLGDGVPGGGVAIETGSLALSGVEITANESGVGGTATSHGGGVSFREDPLDGIADPYDLQWAGVKISDNTANGRGGGVALATAGRIEATQLTLTDNTAALDGGGGHLALDTYLDHSLIDGNSADDGGGLHLDRATAGYYVESTTISGNTATGDGGGVHVEDPDDVVAVNSTVTGNTAARGGGFELGVDPMDEGAPVLLDHVTLTANTAPVGANAAVDVGELQVHRSIVAEPLGGGANCDGGPGGFAPVGWSFLSDATCGVAASDVVSAASPALGPLTDNGGLTPTRLPDAGSPVAGLIPLGSCTVPTDQRDLPRPQGASCEPGAAEIVEAAGPLPILGTPADDVLTGTPRDDELRGFAGRDLLAGLAGDDLLIGGDGGDVLLGGPGDDVLRGGPGVDLLIGGPGRDTLDGGPGPDLCSLPGSLLPRDC